ncbi:MAG: hypothetical protein A2Z28_04310 [Chloroflexi bacterium RBG_16_51_9]|nr:MAG: hypothetical protein A2Z28_04310 [Chloroflexi bacterium RBG_16_51_9]
MAIVMEQQEIETIINESCDTVSKLGRRGDGLTDVQKITLEYVLAKVIARNNALILEALTKAGVKI